MTDKRKVELFDSVLSCLLEHLCSSDIERALKDCCGFTDKDIKDCGILLD